MSAGLCGGPETAQAKPGSYSNGLTNGLIQLQILGLDLSNLSPQSMLTLAARMKINSTQLNQVNRDNRNYSDITAFLPSFGNLMFNFDWQPLTAGISRRPRGRGEPSLKLDSSQQRRSLH